MKIYIFLISFLCVMASFPADAQLTNEQDSPIEISADNSLEWMQNDKQYIANGNVEVTQGDAQIFCDKLVADYRENEKTGSTEIWQLTAYDNVRLINAQSNAQGDKATYEIDSGLAVLTGKNLKLTTPDQIITARDKMEYNINNGKAKAIGNASITQGTDRLTASTITANFIKDANGKQSLKTAQAQGGVTITTPDEVLTGDNAVYNAQNNTAEIKGNVRIKRGPNILEGARGEVNLTTHISKMYGTPNNGKRVKGVFYPSSKPRSENEEGNQ